MQDTLLMLLSKDATLNCKPCARQIYELIVVLMNLLQSAENWG